MTPNYPNVAAALAVLIAFRDTAPAAILVTSRDTKGIWVEYRYLPSPRADHSTAAGGLTAPGCCAGWRCGYTRV